MIIIEGEKKDFEDKIAELELQKSAAIRQLGELGAKVEELVTQRESFEAQLKIENERQLDITHFCNQAYIIRRKIHQVQVSLTTEIYKVKMAERRLNEIAAESLDFITRLLKVS